MAKPEQNGNWQVVNGAVEAEETPLEAALRETYEEAGDNVRVQPLGTVHVSSFHYDDKVRYMLSISYLFAFEGGEIEPGDDMEGSKYQWFSLDEIESTDIKIIIPPGEKWLIARAIDLYRLWKQENVSKQQGFNMSIRGK